MAKSTTVLGLMSGSSLDGLDMALVRFSKEENRGFEMLAAETSAYGEEILSLISNAFNGDALNLARAHALLGRRFGELARTFIEGKGFQCDLISSHGHTVFHQPDYGFTFQAGSGAEIAATTGITTVCDLRSMDVALGGQGAPLVPVGEKMLFPDHYVFLNLGGIANLSIHGSSIKAFDVCLCNLLLNHFSKELRKDYDAGGQLARQGTINPELLETIGSIFRKYDRRSLGREDLNDLLKEIAGSNINPNDKLCTAVEAIAVAITKQIPENETMLVTGGGAYNDYLVERMQAHCASSIELPSKEIIEFKEAIIFAFLGLLRVLERPNALSSVTGASANNIGGAVYHGNSKISS